MDRGGCWATVCGVAKSRTGLRDEHFHFLSLSFRGCVYVRRRSRDHRPSITGHSGDGWGGDNFSFCTLFLSHKMLLKTLFLRSKKLSNWWCFQCSNVLILWWLKWNIKWYSVTQTGGIPRGWLLLSVGETQARQLGPPPWPPGWRTVVPPVRGLGRPGCGAGGDAFLTQTRGPLMGRQRLGWPVHHSGHLGTRLWGCKKPSLGGHLWGGRIRSPEGGACLLLWGFGLCPVSPVVVIVLLTEQVRKQAKGWR